MDTRLLPISLKKWIDEHRASLKPPVGNKMVWEDREFIVMVVGGPNRRTDYHINEGEEFFYQIEGDITLGILENGKPKDIPLHEGDIYLLPPRVPHSPKRPENTVGLVIERKRLKGERDGFLWICPKCHTKLYEEFITLKNIETDLPPVFDRFHSNPEHCVCSRCQTKVHRDHR